MIFKGLMGKRILALWLRSSLIFFASPPTFHSSLGNDHLIIRNKANRQARTDEKKHNSRVPRRWLLPFLSGPSGVKLLVIFVAFLLVFGLAARLQDNGV